MLPAWTGNVSSIQGNCSHVPKVAPGVPGLSDSPAFAPGEIRINGNPYRLGDQNLLLVDRGRNSGERVWPFPIGKEFMDDLKSDTADFLQCSPKGVGDHILAASFLAEFIENDVPWVHLDLAASDSEGGLGHVASKFTGFGVRYTMSAILDENLFKARL